MVNYGPENKNQRIKRSNQKINVCNSKIKGGVVGLKPNFTYLIDLSVERYFNLTSKSTISESNIVFWYIMHMTVWLSNIWFKTESG